MAQTPEKKERDRLYYLANREKIKARVKAYNESRPDAYKEYQRAYREKNSPALKDYGIAYRRANAARIGEQHAAWSRAHPEKNREAGARYLAKYPTVKRNDHLKRRYGMTIEDFEAMWAAQGGKCAICQNELRRGRGGASRDHDHATGVMRSLLCLVCNTRLHALENLDWRNAADAYLKRWGSAAPPG